MDVPLKDVAHEEQRSVIRFLAAEWGKKVKAIEEWLPSMGVAV